MPNRQPPSQQKPNLDRLGKGCCFAVASMQRSLQNITKANEESMLVAGLRCLELSKPPAQSTKYLQLFSWEQSKACGLCMKAFNRMPAPASPMVFRSNSSAGVSATQNCQIRSNHNHWIFAFKIIQWSFLTLNLVMPAYQTLIVMDARLCSYPKFNHF